MAGAENFIKKLKDLSPTSVSIQSLSKWMIFNYKHAANLVATWRQEALRAAPERKITFLYLANDVIQQSRRKGSHFVDEFAKVLPEAYTDTHKVGIADAKSKAARLVEIWRERNLYDNDFLSQLEACLKGAGVAAGPVDPRARPAATGSGSGGGPALTGMAATVAPLLMQVDDLERRAKAMEERLQRLPQEVLACSGDDELPANVPAEEVGKAVRALEAEKSLLEERKKVATATIIPLREALTKLVDVLKTSDERMTVNSQRLPGLVALGDKLGVQSSADGGMVGGRARPPPVADSDDDDVEPQSKRSKVDGSMETGEGGDGDGDYSP